MKNRDKCQKVNQKEKINIVQNKLKNFLHLTLYLYHKDDLSNVQFSFDTEQEDQNFQQYKVFHSLMFLNFLKFEFYTNVLILLFCYYSLMYAITLLNLWMEKEKEKKEKEKERRRKEKKKKNNNQVCTMKEEVKDK